MNTIAKCLACMSVVTLVGCAGAPLDTGSLEGKLGQVRGGDFGTCATKMYEAKLALGQAQARLDKIKMWPGQNSQYVLDEAMAAADRALADRQAAEEACNVRVAALEEDMVGVKSTLADHEERLQRLEGKREVLRGLTFATGSAELSSSARSMLQDVATRLKNDPKVVEVAGHASSTGTPQLNQRLSQARAEAVLAYLVAQGVDGALLSAKGYGISEPIADNATSAGRRANQRVELRYGS